MRGSLLLALANAKHSKKPVKRAKVVSTVSDETLVQENVVESGGGVLNDDGDGDGDGGKDKLILTFTHLESLLPLLKLRRSAATLGNVANSLKSDALGLELSEDFLSIALDSKDPLFEVSADSSIDKLVIKTTEKETAKRRKAVFVEQMNDFYSKKSDAPASGPVAAREGEGRFEAPPPPPPPPPSLPAKCTNNGDAIKFIMTPSVPTAAEREAALGGSIEERVRMRAEIEVQKKGGENAVEEGGNVVCDEL